MDRNIEASYGDQVYMKYKNDMEEMRKKDTSSAGLPNVRIAIFGLGRIGTIHLKNLRENPKAEIVYCIDESKEAIHFLRKKWQLTDVEFLHPSEQEIVFKDKSVNAILVCTPTFLHEELVLKALNSGKAVFCEKPLSVNEEGIERCIATARKNSLPLLCAFNRRFDPGLRSVKARVDAGEIGKVHVIKTCSRDSPKPSVDYLKISGGIFHDCAVHDIDCICWILGEYPESLTCYAHANYDDVKGIDDYDTVVITMKFPSGTLATIDLSRHAVYGYDQRVEVFGPKGMLTNGEQRPTGVRNYNEKGTTAVPIFFSFASCYREAYAEEMDHFLNVVQGKEKCAVELDSILANSKIASACEEAARTGKTITFSWKNLKN